MQAAEVNTRLEQALSRLMLRDSHLLTVDASERSITHQLAVHLMEQFPGYDIDCEYNRDGFDVKRLELAERRTRDDDTEAVTVFPDIVVHLRGHNNDNLLVIEVKNADHGSASSTTWRSCAPSRLVLPIATPSTSRSVGMTVESRSLTRIGSTEGVSADRLKQWRQRLRSTIERAAKD